MTGAALALAGGLALTELGVVALAVGATMLVVGPALWVLRATALAASRAPTTR